MAFWCKSSRNMIMSKNNAVEPAMSAKRKGFQPRDRSSNDDWSNSNASPWKSDKRPTSKTGFLDRACENAYYLDDEEEEED